MFWSWLILGLFAFPNDAFAFTAAAAFPAILSTLSTAFTLINTVRGLFGGKKQSSGGLPQAAPPTIPAKTRPDVAMTGLSPSNQTGPAVSFGQGQDPLQAATNIFTAGTQGRGQIDLVGEIKDPFSARAGEVSRNALLSVLTTGGTPSPGANFPDVGFPYLSKAGAPAQERSVAGGLSALEELIARG